MQVIPDTGALLGVTEKQLYDPKINIDTGTRYLRQMLNRYDQKVVLALAAYNAGPGRVDEANLRVPNITETQNYVKKILSYLAISSHIQEAKN
jgi:soluble lytic murein transglycosylase-like protein